MTNSFNSTLDIPDIEFDHVHGVMVNYCGTGERAPSLFNTCNGSGLEMMG